MTHDTQPVSYYTNSFTRHNGRLIVLEISPSLPNSGASIKNETITILTDSVQHQMTILTLVTHMLLSAPKLNTRLISWDPARQSIAHQQILGIILATLALK